MRAVLGFAAAVAITLSGAGVVSASDGIIGLYADLTATQRNATFSIGVPRTLFIVTQLDGQTAYGMTGAEFRIDGLPADWLVYVTPNPASPVSLGDPFRVVGGAHRANIVFPDCPYGTDGRVLLYTVVVIANSVVESGDLVVLAGDPPTNASWTTPVMTLCDPPMYTAVAVQGDNFHIGTRAPQDLDYSDFPGYDEVRGVQPQRGLPGDVFHFRVVYSSADALLPAAGSPRLELDVNGDGDAQDPGEGVYTMSSADLDSTVTNGKEYRYDVALGEPPGGSYRYRFTAVDARGATVPGAATAWRESLLVRSDLAELSVCAEEIRAVPSHPQVDSVCSIVAAIHNRSERRVDGVVVRIENLYGTTIAERTLSAMGPRSTTEVACPWTFTSVGFQPVVVRIDPAGQMSESDESDNVATHGVYVGGIATTGRVHLVGLPLLVTVPPAAPFWLVGGTSYGTSPDSPVRNGRMLAATTWQDSVSARTDAAGDFVTSFVSPAVPGMYRIAFSLTDGASTDAVNVDVNVTPLAGALPPHGPNLAVQLEAAPGTGCPPAMASLTAAVTNIGDLASVPTTVRFLSGGTSEIAAVSIDALLPGATAVLEPVAAPLGGAGLHAFTALADPGNALRELRKDDNAASATVRVPLDCLDLAIDAVWFVSTPFCSSQAMDLAARVANRGCVGSQPARVAWRVGGSEIASAALAALAPGEWVELQFSEELVTGCYDLEFVLDPEGAAGPDCEVGNDLLGASVCVVYCAPPPPPPPPPPPDLVVAACDIHVSNSRPTLGEELRFEAWIENRSSGDATAPALVHFELDGTPIGDPVAVDSLASHARVLVTSAATWPADFAPHQLVVSVDPNGQGDLSLANNSASRLLPRDLRLHPIGRCPPSTPAMFSTCSPCLGVQLEIRAVIVNDGLFDCDSVQVDFRDVAHGGVVVGSAIARDVLAGGGCIPLPDPVAITHTFTSMGLQRIAAIVDPLDVWPESDETNNRYENEVSVACGLTPDLVASVRLPIGSIPEPGDTVRAVEVQVTNRGTLAAAAVQARLWLDQVHLCDLEMGDLAPGASSTRICTTPWVAASGCSQVLQACADPDNRIGESNEGNNCASAGVAPGETDLGIYPFTIRVTPTDPDAGEQVLIEIGLYSHRGVESTCLLEIGWSLDGSSWLPIAQIPLHLPGSVENFPNAASFMWTVPYPNLYLSFELAHVCPIDINPYNNVAYGSLPWFIAPHTPVVVSDLEAESLPEGVSVRWRAEPVVAGFLLERRPADEGGWTRLPETIPVASGSGSSRYQFLDRSAPVGVRLEYRLVGRVTDGSEERLGSVTVLHAATLARRLELLAVRPNPFRPGSAFEFSLPEPRSVELCVFDAAGRRIASLRSGPQPPGRHSVSWDGRDETGRLVPAGVYFCRLVAGSFQQAHRFVLLR